MIHVSQRKSQTFKCTGIDHDKLALGTSSGHCETSCYCLIMYIMKLSEIIPACASKTFVHAKPRSEICTQAFVYNEFAEFCRNRALVRNLWCLWACGLIYFIFTRLAWNASTCKYIEWVPGFARMHFQSPASDPDKLIRDSLANNTFLTIWQVTPCCSFHDNWR